MNKEIFAKKAEFWHSLKVGDYVGIRYQVAPLSPVCGRIIDIEELPCTGATEKNRATFFIFRIQTNEADIRHEHPEHLFKAKEMRRAA